jgi:membrane protein DedA with SNARE-associated domain
MSHPDWHTLLAHYGYLAVCLGTFIEGESVLLAGGFLAQQGILSLPGVVAAAFTGGLISDQLYFQLGRRQGKRLAKRYPGWQARLERLHGWIARSRNLVIFSFRFIYGVRTLAPLVLGASDVPYLRYILLNACGGAIWSTLVASLGYFFGEAWGLMRG